MSREIGFIFDWDGVVVDSSRQHERSWDDLAAAEGLELFEGHFKLGFGKKNEFIIPNILEWTEDADEIARLSDLKEEFYRKIVRESGLKPLPGVRAFLEELQAKNLPRVIGSSTPRKNIEAVLEITELIGFFDEIVAAADVDRGKPDPEVFLKAAAKIQVKPEDCVVFEDSVSGIEAGKAAGMKVVALATTNSLEELRDTGVALVVESFEELDLPRLYKLFD